MNNKAHLTAITRSKISVPMRYLTKLNLIKGNALDYGCGKGFDAESLGLDKYDPYFFPEKPSKKYDTIVCNYVLNVIEGGEKRMDVAFAIYDLLEEGGKAYITVRRDVKKEGLTKRGTYQINAELPLPILKETSTYCTYIMTK